MNDPNPDLGPQQSLSGALLTPNQIQYLQARIATSLMPEHLGSFQASVGLALKGDIKSQRELQTAATRLGLDQDLQRVESQLTACRNFQIMASNFGLGVSQDCDEVVEKFSRLGGHTEIFAKIEAGRSKIEEQLHGLEDAGGLLTKSERIREDIATEDKNLREYINHANIPSFRSSLNRFLMVGGNLEIRVRNIIIGSNDKTTELQDLQNQLENEIRSIQGLATFVDSNSNDFIRKSGDRSPLMNRINNNLIELVTSINTKAEAQGIQVSVLDDYRTINHDMLYLQRENPEAAEGIQLLMKDIIDQSLGMLEIIENLFTQLKQ